jgi:hypothetical protein
MALFPLIHPTTWETEYLGGIDISMWTRSPTKWPSWIWLSLWLANSLKTSPMCFLRLPYRTFFRYFGIQTRWYLQSHVVWLKLLLFFIESLLEVSFGRFTDRRLSYILPQLSNSGSLPSKAGGLSVIIRAHRVPGFIVILLFNGAVRGRP